MESSAGSTACQYIINKVTLLAIVCTMVMSCSRQEKTEDPLPFYNSAEFTAEWIDKSDAAFKNIHTIASFSFTDQSGKTILSDSMSGKIYAANFFFTTCTSICPKMTKNLLRVQKEFESDKEVELISFSVMPWVDSVARLGEYAQEKGIDESKWHLLTGSQNDIYHLARTSYFAEKGLGLQKDSSEFLHTETVLLIDKHARIRGVYNATTPLDITRMIEDIRLLKKEE